MRERLYLVKFPDPGSPLELYGSTAKRLLTYTLTAGASPYLIPYTLTIRQAYESEQRIPLGRAIFGRAGLTLSFCDFRACWCAAGENGWACWRVGESRRAVD